jgi:hypothetical protein
MDGMDAFTVMLSKDYQRALEQKAARAWLFETKRAPEPTLASRCLNVIGRCLIGIGERMRGQARAVIYDGV